MGFTSKHFTAAELQCHHCGLNECTQGLVDALESFRLYADNEWKLMQIVDKTIPDSSAFPGVRIHDAYRCPAHNASTPNSAKNSQHVQGLAADISVKGMTASDLEAIARRIPAIKGIGRADIQNYLHIDVRETPAEWCYTANGASCKYYYPPT